MTSFIRVNRTDPRWRRRHAIPDARRQTNCLFRQLLAQLADQTIYVYNIIKVLFFQQIDVTELTLNEVSHYVLKSTTNVTLSHVFEKVPIGGRYNICISVSIHLKVEEKYY